MEDTQTYTYRFVAFLLMGGTQEASVLYGNKNNRNIQISEGFMLLKQSYLHLIKVHERDWTGSFIAFVDVQNIITLQEMQSKSSQIKSDYSNATCR
jgi:hypothetical protein